MAAFLMDNAGTILISLILVLAVGLVVRSMYRDRKAGKGGCGCGCGSCAMACHKKGRG